MMSSARKSGDNLNSSANKLRLDSLANKILKIDHRKNHKKQKKDSLSKQVSRVALAELLKNTSYSTSNSNQRASIIYELPDFSAFLLNKENVQVFREFLKTQYCQENIDFYLACEKYKNLDSDGVGIEFVKLMVNQIFNDYLSKDARQPVNISDECKQLIQKQLKTPTPNLFCDAQLEIFNLMATSCYPNFCKTWLLDRELAQKILSERNLDQSTPMNRTTNTIATHNSTLTSILSTPSMANKSATCSTRSESSKHQSHIIDNRRRSPRLHPPPIVGCPPHCPYNRVGLPCQHHIQPLDRTKVAKICPQDLADQLDLSKIHRVPTSVNHSRPAPPPPLPPKPEKMLCTKRSKTSISPAPSQGLAAPFVGKVFNV